LTSELLNRNGDDVLAKRLKCQCQFFFIALNCFGCVVFECANRTCRLFSQKRDVVIVKAVIEFLGRNNRFYEMLSIRLFNGQIKNFTKFFKSIYIRFFIGFKLFQHIHTPLLHNSNAKHACEVNHLGKYNAN